MKIITTIVLSVIMFSVTPFLTGFAWADPVNINNADVPTLSQALKGIGEKKAQAIIDYRNQNGAFTSIDELAKVKGINAKTIDKNRADINL